MYYENTSKIKKSNQKAKLEAAKMIKMIANRFLAKARRAWILQTAVVMTMILLILFQQFFIFI
jgi:hypothetical protein